MRTVINSRLPQRRPAASSPRNLAVERVNAAAETARRGKPIFWSRDAMKRAHVAMLDSGSSDLLTLARCALQAAIRNERDLLALLPEPTTPRARMPSISAVL